MTPALSTSDAALLEATSDPLAYIERSVVIRHMDTLQRFSSCRSVFPPPRVCLVVDQDLQPH